MGMPGLETCQWMSKTTFSTNTLSSKEYNLWEIFVLDDAVCFEEPTFISVLFLETKRY